MAEAVDKEKKRAVVDAYAGGKSAGEVAKEFSVDRKSVYNWAKELGVKKDESVSPVETVETEAKPSGDPCPNPSCEETNGQQMLDKNGVCKKCGFDKRLQLS